MHELSVAQAIIDSAVQELEADQRVLMLRLQLGPLSGVVEEALRFSFDLATQDTPLQGCRLDVQTVPVTLYCADCRRITQPPELYRLVCADCQKPSSDVRSGRELLIIAMEVDDEPANSRTS